jgi:hypothetical protein
MMVVEHNDRISHSHNASPTDMCTVYGTSLHLSVPSCKMGILTFLHWEMGRYILPRMRINELLNM